MVKLLLSVTMKYSNVNHLHWIILKLWYKHLVRFVTGKIGCWHIDNALIEDKLEKQRKFNVGKKQKEMKVVRNCYSQEVPSKTS